MLRVALPRARATIQARVLFTGVDEGLTCFASVVLGTRALKPTSNACACAGVHAGGVGAEVDSDLAVGSGEPHGAATAVVRLRQSHTWAATHTVAILVVKVAARESELGGALSQSHTFTVTCFNGKKRK